MYKVKDKTKENSKIIIFLILILSISIAIISVFFTKVFPDSLKFIISVNVVFYSLILLNLFGNLRYMVYFDIIILMIISVETQGVFMGLYYSAPNAKINISLFAYSIIFSFIIEIFLNREKLFSLKNKKENNFMIIIFFFIVAINILVQKKISNKLIDSYMVPFMFYLLIKKFISKYGYKKIINIFLGICCILSLYGIIELIVGKNIILHEYYSNNTPWYILTLGTVKYGLPYRITTFLGHPLVNASYFLVALVFACEMYFNERKSRYLIMIILFCINVFSTFSRAAFLILVIYLVFLRNCIGKREKNNILITMGMLVIITAIILANDSIISGLLQRFSREQGSLSVRMDSFKLLAQISMKDLFLGIGFNNAGNLRMALTGGLSNANFENGFIIQLIEMGVIAFIFYYGYVISIIYQYFNNTKRNKKMDLIFLGSFLIFCMHCFTYNSIGDPNTLNNVFWLLLALISSNKDETLMVFK